MASNISFDLNFLPCEDLYSNFDEIQGSDEGPMRSEVQELYEINPVYNGVPQHSNESNSDCNNSNGVTQCSDRQGFILDLNARPHEELECPTVEVIGEIFEDVDQPYGDNVHESSIELDENEFEEQQPKTYRLISDGERQLIYTTLLERRKNGKLKRSTTHDVSSSLSIPLKTVQRVWKRAKATPVGTCVNVSDRRVKNCGRKRIDLDINRITGIPLNRRTTLRSIAQALDSSKSTVHRRYKEGDFRRHSNAIMPHLKEENKIARLKFCISMLETNSLSTEPKFIGMYNIVHIDEKWFYITKKSKKYYLLREEKDPLRSCQSKNFIGKVMFLVALARPRLDGEGNEVFSGKLGVFPLVTKQPALRRSRNRDAGTLETKPITSVTRDVIRGFLIGKVIPAIQSMWPSEDLGKAIFIQQDNAKTHVHPDDAEFQMVVAQSGFDIRLFYQPANSPDLNVLDLGFFSEIQSLQDKECTKNVDELIHAVEKSFEEYPSKKINNVFLTLQSCMKEVMLIEGSNDYKTPHMGKDRLARNGDLPAQIHCDYSMVEKVMDILQGRHE